MKRTVSLAVVCSLLFLLCLPVASASGIVTSNDNPNTNIEFREDGYVYVEFVQGSQSFPISTDSGFIKTEVTAEDASGTSLGSVHSTDGVLDYSAYLGQAVRLHIVNQYTDEYLILEDGGESAPVNMNQSPSGPPAGASGPNPLMIFGACVFLIMIIIIITAAVAAAKERKKQD